jgi:hypothetical protein
VNLGIDSGTSINDVVDSYWVFLARNQYQLHLQRFQQRLVSNPKAAEAEAVVFSLLWSTKTQPDIFEDVSKGGPDFCCHPKKNTKFLVEVTSLDSGAVARRSKWPERIDHRGGGPFGLITAALSSAAGSKAAQMAGYPHPRVLAITCSHIGAQAFMGRLAAQNLLLSDPRISYRFGDPPDHITQVTDLRRAVFFRGDKSGSRIIPYRQSISAILLVAIFGNQASVVGILHPKPTIVFDPGLFPHIPYLRVKDWPILDGRIFVEWLASDHDPGAFYHSRIR